MKKILSNANTALDTIVLLSALAWLSMRFNFSFLERKALIYVYVLRGYIYLPEKFGSEEFGLDRSLKGYDVQISNVVDKINGFPHKNLEFDFDKSKSDEESIIEFINPIYSEFKAILNFEDEYRNRRLLPKDYYQYDLLRRKFQDSDKGEGSVDDDIKLTRYRLHSIKLYESFLNLLENDHPLFEHNRKLSRYLFRFTEDDTEGSALISLTFWNGLPRLLRRMAATSDSTYEQVKDGLLKETCLSLLRLVDKRSLDDNSVYSLHCFVERYTRFLKLPPSYTSDEIVAQAASKVLEDGHSFESHSLSATTRLECYSIISQLSSPDTEAQEYRELDIEAMEKEIADTLEKEVKKLLIFDHYDSHACLKQVDATVRIFRQAKEYLQLAIRLDLKDKESLEFKELIASSAHNSDLLGWIERIDSLLVESLDKGSQQVELCKTDFRYHDPFYRSRSFGAITCLFLSLGFGFLLHTPRFEHARDHSMNGDLNKVVKKVKSAVNYEGRDVMSGNASDPYNFYLKEEGFATYSGSIHQNKVTASGQRFDKNKLTASHHNLPFKSKVKIVNLENQKDVTVEIIDRIPDDSEKVIDMSESAASAIDMLDDGVERVSIEVIDLNNDEN